MHWIQVQSPTKLNFTCAGEDQKIQSRSDVSDSRSALLNRLANWESQTADLACTVHEPLERSASSPRRKLVMMRCRLSLLLVTALWAPLAAKSQSAGTCADLAGLKIDGVEIAKAAPVPSGATIPPAYPGALAIGPLPAHCRVDGIINRRKGIDGQEFGIGFAVALPERTAWNGDVQG